MSSSGHPAGVFFCLIARLRPGLGLALAFLGNPCLGFQWLSFRERVQCPLLSSWWRCASGPPLLLGWQASLSRPSQRKTNRMGDRYNL